jgi:hypothetical protein
MMCWSTSHRDEPRLHITQGSTDAFDQPRARVTPVTLIAHTITIMRPILALFAGLLLATARDPVIRAWRD